MARASCRTPTSDAERRADDRSKCRFRPWWRQARDLDRMRTIPPLKVLWSRILKSSRQVDLSVVLSAVVLAFTLLQVRLLLDPERVLMLERVWAYRGLPSEARSALFFAGEDFWKFVEFVKEVVPEDATIVVPRQEQAYHFGNIGIMNFFLFPRALINCGSVEYSELERCIGNIQDSRTYVLAVDAFPPPELALRRLEYRAYNEALGVYVPR